LHNSKKSSTFAADMKKALLILAAMAMILVGCNNELSLQTKFYEVHVTDAGWIPMDSMYHYAKLQMPQITQDVIDHGLVQVYRIIEQNDKVYYAPLPATLTDFDDSGNLVSTLIDYDYTLGEIYVYVTFSDLNVFENPGEHKFRVAISK